MSLKRLWPFLCLRPVLAVARILVILFLARAPIMAAPAIERVQAFDVPAGEAVETLKTTAKQGGVEIIFLAETVHGIRTVALRGEFTPSQALARLVTNTGLIVVRDERTSTLTVKRAPPSPKNPPKTDSSPTPQKNTMKKLGYLISATLGLTAYAQTAPGPAAAASATQDPAPLQLSPFEVSAKNDRGYGSAYSLGGTRIALPISDVTGYVVTVNEALIKDTGAVRFEDAAKYISGVTGTSQASSGRFTIRGYDPQGSMIRDGLPANSSVDFFQPVDTSVYDRLEIIKGPNGVLYGAHSLGGLANRITKRPLSARVTEVSADFGSFNTFRANLDSTGAIDQNQKLAYRLIGTWQEGDARQGEDNNLRSFNLQFEYRLSPDSKLRLYVLNTQADLPRETSTLADINKAPHTFWSSRHPQQQTNEVYNDTDYWDYEVSYTNGFKILDSEWALNLVARAFEGKNLWLLDTPLGNRTAYDASGNVLGFAQNITRDAPIARVTTANYYRRFWDDKANSWLANFDVTGKFSTGPVKHVLFTGLQTNGGETYTRQFQIIGAAPAGGIEIWPRLSIPALPSSAQLGLLANATTFRKIKVGGGNYNWAIQDNAYLFKDRVVLVAGARYDHGGGDTTHDFRTNRITTGVTYNELTPKYGIVVKPVKGVALFYNKTQTFEVVSTFDTRLASPTYGELFPNREGKVDEFGMKLELFNNRVIATSSYFDIELTNALATQTDDDAGSITGIPRGAYGIPSGKATNKGFEVDVSVEPVDGLQLMLAYSDLEARTEIGVRQRNAPQNTFSAFGRYAFSRGVLKGISLGGGFQHVADRSWDGADTGNLPDYTVYEAFVSYEYRPHWSFQLNVRNLTDELYYRGSTNRDTIFWGEPRTIQFRSRYRF